MSRYDRYDSESLQILYAVQDIVRRRGRDESRLDDLAKAILISAIPDVLAIAQRNARVLNRERLKSLYESLSGEEPPARDEPIRLSLGFRSVLDEAERAAEGSPVEPAHIIKAAWDSIKGEIGSYLDPDPSEALAEADDPQAGVEGSAVLDAEGLPSIEYRPGSLDLDDGLADLVLPEEGPSPERERALDYLLSLSREMTAPDYDTEVFGREAEIDAVASILMRRYKPYPLVIGDPGVGKTAVVRGLAQRMKEGRVPPALMGCRLFEIRLSELAAGTTVHGAYEERLKNLVGALEILPDCIVFFDEIHQAAQSYGNEPTADILKPSLSRGLFRCIGATTLADYHRFMEKDEAFTRRFQTVLVKEPGQETLARILSGVREGLEEHFGLSIAPALLDRATALASQRLGQRRFPDKAIDLLDRACSLAAFRGEITLTEEDLRAALSDLARLAAEAERPNGADDWGIEGLEERLALDVVGQESSIASISTVIRVCKRHLDMRPERPDGAFLFTGPTGVGKTALAESLARRLTGRDDALFRIDMSEFSESHSVARLLGAPPGYIGYGDIALLGAAAEKIPDGVLLLDEFEKAHPQVHRLFLQIFDSGRATDAYGKILSFSDMTIVATCNVNADSMASLGFGRSEGVAGPPLEALKRVFPPELLNRFDALIPFRALERSDCLRILRDIVIAKSNAGLEKEYGLALDYDEPLLEAILDAGFSRDFGARHLHRAFQEIVILPLSDGIESWRGKGRVRAGFLGGKAVFSEGVSPRGEPLSP